jgi:hypothetical protein
MTHTLGPWYVNGDCIEADGPDGPRDITVAVATATRRGYDDTADARLIAAAPELLRELKYLVEEFAEAVDWVPEYVAMTDRAKAAIAKAEGRE